MEQHGLDESLIIIVPVGRIGSFRITSSKSDRYRAWQMMELAGDECFSSGTRLQT